MTHQQLLDLYSLQHEYNPIVKDFNNRAKFFNSPDHQNFFNPIVSKHLIQKGFEPTYPNNKSFAIALSHDIDVIYQHVFKTKFHKLNSILKIGKKLGIKSNHIKKIITETNPKILLDINKEFGINTTFFLLCLKNGDRDFTYTLNDIDFFTNKNIFGNNEMQLHGGHNAYNNYEKLVEEKQYFELHFNQKTNGYRNHYLKFNVPQSWKNLEQAGFEYDTTIGFAELPGFRNGMCHLYNPLINNQFLNIVEIPLMIMDTTLFEYCRLDAEEGFKLINWLLDIVKEHKGAVSILWHNHYLKPPYNNLYKKMIELILEKNGWITTCGELTNHWKKNNYHTTTQQLLLN